MNSNHATFPFITIIPSSNPKTLSFPKYPLSFFQPKKTHFPLKVKRTSFVIRASNDDNSQTASNWSKWIPTGSFAADQVFRLIAGATASPIGQFVSSPTTFLHSIDPRVKLVWLLALVVLPARSHIIMRFGLVIFLTLLSIWVLQRDVWKDQLGRVYFLSGLLFITLGLGADGVPSVVQLRTPPPALTGLPNFPVSLSGGSSEIFLVTQNKFLSDCSGDGGSAYVTKVKIHNLGTDSWRRIKEYPSGIPMVLAAKLVTGTLNWLAYAPNLTSYAIVSLDLGKESCQELLQPDYGEVNVLSFSLGVLKNCLSIIVHYEEGFSDVWLMNDYGKKESWTKFLCLPFLGSPHVFPHGKVICIYGDEVLLQFNSDLSIYNFRNGTFKFPEIPDFCRWPDPQIYVESLISPCS